MLTQLATVKARLGIAPADVSQDDLLTRAIEAVGARCDRECGRTLQRTVGAEHIFPACETEIVLTCYPVESVTRFELKSTEAEGWQEQLGVDYLIRSASVISLVLPLAPMGGGLARLTYTGGYVPPGTVVGPGQTALPKDLENAAVEQVAAWYQNKDKLGLLRHWPSGGTYLVISQLPLLPAVAVTLRRYQRWMV
jgi:hypothetical protein